MLLVEQKLFTLPEHMSSPVFSVVDVVHLSFSVYCFVHLWWLFCTFSFRHCYRFIFIPDLSSDL